MRHGYAVLGQCLQDTTAMTAIEAITQPLALARSDEHTASSRRNHPKRATTKPKPIMAMPVRIHASSVRSAAKWTRGSPADGLGI